MCPSSNFTTLLPSLCDLYGTISYSEYIWISSSYISPWPDKCMFSSQGNELSYVHRIHIRHRSIKSGACYSPSSGLCWVKEIPEDVILPVGAVAWDWQASDLSIQITQPTAGGLHFDKSFNTSSTKGQSYFEVASMQHEQIGLREFIP